MIVFLPTTVAAGALAPLEYAAMIVFLPTTVAAGALAPLEYAPLPVGAVTPRGWLLSQLSLQAQGLSGHLAQFWPDVSKSVWIGGGGDGGLHERTPYWLNGVVPLAFLLRNANVTLAPVRGVWKAPSRESSVAANASLTRDPAVSCAKHGALGAEPVAVDLLAQVRCYIDYILSTQAADGWLGPPDDGDGQAPWGRAYVLLALAAYAEAVPSEFGRVSLAMLQYALCLRERLKKLPLAGWAQQRWQEIALGAHWLLDHAPRGRQPELLELLAVLRTQGSDWEAWFEDGTFAGRGVRGANGHNVNNAQALKTAAVAFRLARGNATLATLSRTRVHKLDAHCGLSTGMFVGDELIPPAPTHSPSRGIELCGVVEAMFSFATMFSVFGDGATLDRAERIAYNALPATWASPKGGDMWAHQYLQAVNQMQARLSHPHVWTHDHADAERYGLEPNFGCCTANFNQGWCAPRPRARARAGGTCRTPVRAATRALTSHPR